MREVAAAITVSTITTVAIFLPIGFVGGLVSQFFLPFGLAVTFAMLASLLVALTVIPVLAYLFIDKVNVKLDDNGELPETIWQRLYTPMLELALRSRVTKWGTLGMATVLLALAAMAIAGSLPTAFIDMGGENLVSITVVAAAGCLVRRPSARRPSRPRTSCWRATTWTWSCPPSPARATPAARPCRRPSRAVPPTAPSMTARIAEGADIEDTREAIKADLEPVSSDGFDVVVSSESPMAAGMSGMAIVVSGADPEQIEAASDVIVADLADMDGIDNLASDAVAEAPQVLVAVDPNMAMMIGSTTAQVGTEIRGVLVGSPLGTYSLDDGSVLDAQLRVSDVGVDSVEGLAPDARQRHGRKRCHSATSPMSTWSRCAARSRASTARPRRPISAEIITEDTGCRLRGGGRSASRRCARRGASPTASRPPSPVPPPR